MNAWSYQPELQRGRSTLRKLCSPLRETHPCESAVRMVWWALVKKSLSAWNQLEVHGLDQLPTRPPMVLVSNHSSHLDALVLAATLPLGWRDHFSPLAAGDHFFSSIARARFSAVLLNALPLWRASHHHRHSLKDLKRRLLTRSSVYVIFPEGSRSRTGGMQEFKAGFGALVAGTSIPVVPCHLEGTFAALPPQRIFIRPAPITVVIGQPITFETVINRRAGWEQISGTVRSAILRLKSPSPGHEARPRPAPVWEADPGILRAGAQSVLLD